MLTYQPGLYCVVLRDKARTNHDRFTADIILFKATTIKGVKRHIQANFHVPKPIDNYNISMLSIITETKKETQNVTRN